MGSCPGNCDERADREEHVRCAVISLPPRRRERLPHRRNQRHPQCDDKMGRKFPGQTLPNTSVNMQRELASTSFVRIECADYNASCRKQQNGEQRAFHEAVTAWESSRARTRHSTRITG